MQQVVISARALSLKAMALCTSCGMQFGAGQRFCAGCGAPAPAEAPPAQLQCGSCFAMRPRDQNFCPQCGSGVVAAGNNNNNNDAGVVPGGGAVLQATVVGMPAVAQPVEIGPDGMPVAVMPSTTPLVEDITKRPGAVILFHPAYMPAVSFCASSVFTIRVIQQIFFWPSEENLDGWDESQWEQFEFWHSTGNDIANALCFPILVHVILMVIVFREKFKRSRLVLEVVLFAIAWGTPRILSTAGAEITRYFPVFMWAIAAGNPAGRTIRLMLAPKPVTPKDRVRLWGINPEGPV